MSNRKLRNLKLLASHISLKALNEAGLTRLENAVLHRPIIALGCLLLAEVSVDAEKFEVLKSNEFLNADSASAILRMSAELHLKISKADAIAANNGLDSGRVALAKTLIENLTEKSFAIKVPVYNTAKKITNFVRQLVEDVPSSSSQFSLRFLFTCPINTKNKLPGNLPDLNIEEVSQSLDVTPQRLESIETPKILKVKSTTRDCLTLPKTVNQSTDQGSNNTLLKRDSRVLQNITQEAMNTVLKSVNPKKAKNEPKIETRPVPQKTPKNTNSAYRMPTRQDSVKFSHEMAISLSNKNSESGYLRLNNSSVRTSLFRTTSFQHIPISAEFKTGNNDICSPLAQFSFANNFNATPQGPSRARTPSPQKLKSKSDQQLEIDPIPCQGLQTSSNKKMLKKVRSEEYKKSNIELDSDPLRFADTQKTDRFENCQSNSFHQLRNIVSPVKLYIHQKGMSPFDLKPKTSQKMRLHLSEKKKIVRNSKLIFDKNKLLGNYQREAVQHQRKIEKNKDADDIARALDFVNLLVY